MALRPLIVLSLARAGYGRVASPTATVMYGAMLETSNPKLQALLENANNVVIDLDGRVKAFEPLQANLAGITADFNAMTTDSKNKLREILWPPAKHGWARVGQVATYLLRPIFEGARLYFQLTALPVRLTNPVPILKAP